MNTKNEIVILQPMEPAPSAKSTQSGQIIMVHYTEDKIRAILRESGQNIPSFKGYLNYYGNRVLESSDVMTIICDEIKKQGKYLVVSTDSRKSFAPSAAKKVELPFMEIDYVFSIGQSESGINDSLRHCAVLAQKKGSLLVKGQPVPQFINALKQNRQLFLDNGIQFVYVSDLLNPVDNQSHSSDNENSDKISP
ncbi:MAG TPA: divergent polysaccharide deacetylase family protein [Chitinispirillaceae bacterium]|nr:divergent polysaccharide deacetylase family protein [Chitinispirillaceae bacterium]